MLTTAVITLLLVLCFAGMSFAEEQATAADLRLIKTEGNVTLTNDAGVKLPSVANMKLTSGTHIKTDGSGYAWLGLDETKFIKLDHSTDANIVKEGKLFKVNIDAGKVFFNVTAPLKKDEEMRIHTSTTITGIRGTIGVIGLENGAGSPLTVQILEGQTYNTVVNPETGANITALTAAGESCKLTVPTEDVLAAGTGIAVGAITAENIPTFVVDEMISDSTIADRTAAATPSLDVPLLLGLREEELKRASATTSISKPGGSSGSSSAGGSGSKKKAEEEAKRKAAEEEAKRKAAEEEAKRKAAEEEAKRKAAEEEAKRKAEEEAKKKAEEEAKKQHQHQYEETSHKRVSGTAITFDITYTCSVSGCTEPTKTETGKDSEDVQYHKNLHYTNLNEQGERRKGYDYNEKTGEVVAYGGCPTCQAPIEIHYESKEAARKDGVPVEQ